MRRPNPGQSHFVAVADQGIVKTHGLVPQPRQIVRGIIRVNSGESFSAGGLSNRELSRQ